MKRELWRDLAKCAGKGVDFFSDEPEVIAQAKAICASCPVDRQCREAGQSEEFGVWGGQSRKDRKQARRAG